LMKILSCTLTPIVLLSLYISDVVCFVVMAMAAAGSFINNFTANYQALIED